MILSIIPELMVENRAKYIVFNKILIPLPYTLYFALQVKLYL